MTGTRWIFCGGMPRSGSTWSYNAAKLLAAEAQKGRPVAALFAASPEEIDAALDEPRQPGATVILKFHKASERIFTMLASGEASNVFTYRHPLQAIASWREIFGFDLDAALQVMRDALIDMDRYRSAPGTVFVSMQEIIETVEIATTRLAAHLGLTLDKAVLDDIARRTSTERMAEIARSLTRWPEEALIDVGHSRYDPETHLHLGHITRGLARDYQATLSLEEQALCETALAEWRFAFEHWR